MTKKKGNVKTQKIHQAYPVVKVKDEIVRKSLDIISLIDSFLASQDIRPLSKAVYRQGLEKFTFWKESNQITQPDRTTILKFKTYLLESGLSVNTTNSYLVSVKRFFSYLEGERLYPDIAKNVKGAKQPKGFLRESPTLDQVKSMLSGIDTATIRGKRDFAMINLMARTGLRTIELSRSNLEDIKQESGEALLYIQGKGRDSKDEFVLLITDALKPILAYLKARGKTDPKDPLFVSHSDRNYGQRLRTGTIRNVSKASFRSIGIDKPGRMCAHSFRHFFATQSLRAGADLIQVKEAMRHSSIETTQKYLHNLDRIEKGAERFIDF